MSEELYNDGFSNIVNVDFSPVVIKSMQEKCKDKNGLQCMNSIPRCFTFVVKKMDMRELDFPDGIFHSVLDKATLDSVLCAEGSLPLAAKCLSEISRVLESGGVFVSISHGAPNTRMQILDRPEYGWTVSVHTVPKPMLKAVRDHISPDGADEERVYHYVYVCAKQ
jgi:SAM-dependent methyltransferase